MVEVQKPMVFCGFCGARATLCGDRRGRGAKTHGFLRFLFCSRDPLRGSAWSRCKNPWFFAISAVLAQPSAGIGVVEAQKRPRELSRGSRACSRNRRVAGLIPPWSAGGRRKMQLAFYSNLRRATCAEQVAQSNLRRPTCTDQFAQSALPRATCAEQLTQSNLHRATCTEQLAQSNLQGAQFAQSNLQGPTCRSNLRGATCAEQLAQCNLRRATCADQLAPTSLRRAPCLVLSRACFTKCREKERILQRWADLACDVLLSGQPWSSLTCSRDPLRGSAWSRCKNPWFFALARPSAGIGVVEVQKPMVFWRFLRCSRNPLRESAWSRCKNPWFFAISNLLARPSAGIGVVEVQKPMVFCDSLIFNVEV